MRLIDLHFEFPCSHLAACEMNLQETGLTLWLNLKITSNIFNKSEDNLPLFLTFSRPFQGPSLCIFILAEKSFSLKFNLGFPQIQIHLMFIRCLLNT